MLPKTLIFDAFMRQRQVAITINFGSLCVKAGAGAMPSEKEVRGQLEVVVYHWILPLPLPHSPASALVSPPAQPVVSPAAAVSSLFQPGISTGPVSKPLSKDSGATVSFLHLTLVCPVSPQLVQVTLLSIFMY